MKATKICNEIYCEVPFEFKEKIKAAGAYWHGQSKRWVLRDETSSRDFLKLNFFGIQTVGFDFEPENIKEQFIDCNNPLPPLAPGINLYQHQINGYNLALNEFKQGGHGYAYLMDMGTGKTLTALAVAAQLYKDKKLNKIIISCPLSVFGAWQSDIKMLSVPYVIKTINGTIEQRNKALKELARSEGLQVAIINYEAAWRMETELLRFSFDMAICDESQRIKNPAAKQSKFFHKLGKSTKYKMILTGTPVANTPLDYFSQYKFLDDNLLGGSYYSVRAKCAIMGGFEGRQIIGYHPEIKQFLQKVHSVAYRVKAEDCLDLPPQIDTYRTVILEPEAKKLYNQIARESYAEILGGTVTPAQAIVKALRLCQITGGFVGMDIEQNGDEKAVMAIQAVSNAKLDEFEEICEELFANNKKVIIFARFRAEIEAICARLTKLNAKYVMINGDTAPEQRTENILTFQKDGQCLAFVSNAQCAGLGVTLTAGAYTIFYSYSYNYIDYEQARKRTHRIGQSQTCNYIHLEVKNSIDTEIIEALKHKRGIAEFSVDEIAKLFKKLD